MSYKWRCTGGGSKFKLWLVLLFQKGLFVYNFHNGVGNNHKIVQACGGMKTQYLLHLLGVNAIS